MRLGFSLAYEIPGLLWTQVLIFFVAGLPVVALATVTASLVPFISTVLILAVITLVGLHGVPGVIQAHLPVVPLAVDWIGSAAFGAAISCLAAVVIVWQYRDRRTLFSQLFGVVAFYLATAAYIWLPPALPLTIQTWLSKEPALASPVRVSVEPAKRRDAAALMHRTRTVADTMQIPLPLVLTGLPEGVEARSDQLSVSFEWPGRTVSPNHNAGVSARSSGKGEVIFDAVADMSPQLFAAMRQAPMTIRGSVYITLFGEAESRKISLKRGPVNVQDGLQCYADEFKGEITQMRCRSFFSWPARLVYAQGNGDENDFSNSLVSYSPFPAGLSLSAMQLRWAEPIKADEATIVTKKPLVHFKRDFELRGIRLADFEEPLHPPPPGQVAR
jgi:hypothetical protein